MDQVVSAEGRQLQVQVDADNCIRRFGVGRCWAAMNAETRRRFELYDRLLKHITSAQFDVYLPIGATFGLPLVLFKPEEVDDGERILVLCAARKLQPVQPVFMDCASDDAELAPGSIVRPHVRVEACWTLARMKDRMVTAAPRCLGPHALTNKHKRYF